MVEKSIAVILPARNEEVIIEKTINSILNQTVKPSKIIIVLDRCNDNTEKIVDKIRIKNQKIEKIVKTTTKYPKTFMKGFLVAEAVNEGLKKLDTFPEYIMIANSDSIYSNNYIEEAMKIFEEESNVGLVGYSHYYAISGTGYLFRSIILEKLGNQLKECASEDTYMQFATLNLGYSLKKLNNVSLKMLRDRGEGNFKNNIKYSFAKGYGAYTLGYSFLFELVRSVYWLTKGDFSSFGIILGYVYASLKRVKKLDIAYTDVPKKWQKERIHSFYSKD